MSNATLPMQVQSSPQMSFFQTCVLYILLTICGCFFAGAVGDAVAEAYGAKHPIRAAVGRFIDEFTSIVRIGKYVIPFLVLSEPPVIEHHNSIRADLTAENGELNHEFVEE